MSFKKLKYDLFFSNYYLLFSIECSRLFKIRRGMLSLSNASSAMSTPTNIVNNNFKGRGRTLSSPLSNNINYSVNNFVQEPGRK